MTDTDIAEPEEALQAEAEVAETEEEILYLDDEYDTLLRELGWRDWSAIMETNLQRPLPGIAAELPLRESVLKHNIRRYGIYNATRTIAVNVISLIYEYLIDEREFELDSQITRDAFVNLIVRMLYLQPNNPPVELPEFIRNISDESEREDAAYEYDYIITRRNLLEHIQETVSDLMEVCYGTEVISAVQKKRAESELTEEEEAMLGGIDIDDVVSYWTEFEENVSHMLHVHYLEPYFGQTPLLGEALLSCTLKFAFDNNDVDLLTMLYRVAAKTGCNIHNHFGITNPELLTMLTEAAYQCNQQNDIERQEKILALTQEAKGEPIDPNAIPVIHVDTNIPSGSWIERTNRKGEKVKVEIENGDILVYRSRSKLAGEIGFGAMPSWNNWRGILKHRLWIGSLTGMVLHLNDQSADDGLDAVERIRGRLQYRHWLVPGYNHTGVAKVFKAEMGLQQHRAVDAYPDGGIRIIGMDEFAHNGPQMRFAVVKADAAKFYQHMKDYRKRHGYQDTAWTSSVATYDDTKGLRATDTQANWPVMISREEFERLHDAPKLAGEIPEGIVAWKEAVNARMVDHIIDHFLLDMGAHYATGFINVYGGLYCSQTPIVAMLQATGIDYETWPDHFSLGVKIVGMLGLAPGTPFDSRIVAPSGTYVQPFQVVHGVNFPYINPLSQAMANTSPRYVSMWPHMRELLYDPAEEKSSALIDEGKGENEYGYFGERATLVSGAADSIRDAVKHIQDFAGFEDKSVLGRMLRTLKEGSLWLFGI